MLLISCKKNKSTDNLMDDLGGRRGHGLVVFPAGGRRGSLKLGHWMTELNCVCGRHAVDGS